jgi:hypothetical protein
MSYSPARRIRYSSAGFQTCCAADFQVGRVTSYTIGGLIHILLAIASIMILVNLISGRRPVI